MVVRSTVELSNEEVLRIYDAVHKHHQAFLAVAYAGDMHPERVLYGWFQTEEFNIWPVDYDGSTDDYLIEVCPRDYPNDIGSKADTFVKPTKFDYSYVTIYYPTEVHRIELPFDYWNFYHSDVSSKTPYKPGYETWPIFQTYAHEGSITDVPEELLSDDY